MVILTMLEFLRNWISSVVTASVLVSIALAVTPEGGVKKAIHLASGLIMTLVLLSPFTNGIPRTDLDIPEIQEIYGGEDSELMKEIIEERTAAYIVNKAQAMGLSVSANVFCESGGPYPLPISAVISSDDPARAQKELESIIEADLGISPERQHYK